MSDAIFQVREDSRFPCILKDKELGLCAYRPNDWNLVQQGPYHPPGFIEWLNECPELYAVDIQKNWFEKPNHWIGLTGKNIGKKVFPRSRNVLGASGNMIESLFNPNYTNAYRIAHAEVTSREPVCVDRWGNLLLVNSALEYKRISSERRFAIEIFFRENHLESIYFQKWEKSVRGVDLQKLAPNRLIGTEASFPTTVLENGLKYLIRFDQGLSVGLFLDHRENRRRWIDKEIEPGWNIPASGEVLNTFAYTCGFSLAAASIGWKTTSLDLSPKYLEWGKKNYHENDISLDRHDFIFGDTFDWMNRWKKRGRFFDAIILDPPTFSKFGKKKSHTFRAERDYERLVALAGLILKKGGLLLASTNSQKIKPSHFLKQCLHGLESSGHSVRRYKFTGQGVDFMIDKNATPHLKAYWFQL